MFNTKAQESYLRHYSTGEGLPSTETYSVFQDSKGYIWVASDMGVSRFNGYTFKVFTTADGLTDNTVFRFYEDPKGRIWFLTFSGRLCYFYNDTIYGKNFPVNQKIRDFLGSNYLTGIGGWNNDTIMLSTSNGLLKLIPETENNVRTWENLDVLNNKNTCLLQDGYLTVEPALNNSTLLTHFSKKKPPQEIRIPRSYSVFEKISESASDLTLIIFTDYTYLLKNDSIVAQTDTINHTVWSSFENDSTFWVGRRYKGICLFSISNLITPIKEFLRPLTVTSILKDREDAYWFTTLEDGVFYLPSDKFQHFTRKSGQLSDGKIRLAVDNKSGVWIVTEKKILHSNKANGLIEYFPGLSVQLNTYGLDYFLDLQDFDNGNVWISHSTGISIGNVKSSIANVLIDFSKPDKKIEYDSRKVIKDHNNNIWSIDLSLLRRIDLQSKKIKQLIPIPARAQTLCEDYHGNILIGTVNGLYCWKNDSLSYLGNENPIYKNRFVDLMRYKDEVAGATRGSGVVIISNDTVMQISTANGLVSNMCRSVFVDSSGVIWVATNKGLNSVKITGNPFKIVVNSFTVADGLPSDDIEQVLKSGNLVWIVTQKEVTSFNPDSVLYNNVAPPIYITKLAVDQKAFSPLLTNEFSYTSNFIDINYNGLTYKNAGKQDYKYKLEGLNNAWAYTKNPFVQFTKLPPGNYKFIVRCINSSGKESERPAVLEFKINAPFYEKWWFNILVLFLSVMVIAIISAIVILRVRKQEKNKTEINRKIANLELHALRAQMNPHFIFNCLNAIQDFILKNDSESAKHYLSRFSKLIRTTLNNSRKQNIPLAQEIEFLNLYLELERMRFNDKFDYQISADNSVDMENTEVPSMILQPFVENAVRHGKIGGMQTQGKLNIHFSVSGSELICVIDDNGIGLNEAVRMKKGSEQLGQTHALDIMKERVQTFNEVNASKIRYKITDKSDIDANEKGTRIEFFLTLNSISI
jgi:ligand-binding sensor domain-containing protein